MTIKEAEQRTGLSAKTIRYYEKEGLLEIKRNKHNSYRTYSEEDIALLKRIKLFRYLDFSVAEIKSILNADDETVSDLLKKQAELLREQSETCQDKKDLCISLSKDLRKNIGDPAIYEETLEFYEDEETQVLINELAIPSMSELIISTLIYLGPILYLFFNIQQNRWDLLPLSAIFALASVAVLTLEYRAYWDWRKHRPAALKRKNQKDKTEVRKILPKIIGSLAIVILLALIITEYMINTLMAPDGWLFYELQSPGIFVSLLPLVAILFFTYIINGFLQQERLPIKRTVVGFLILLAGTYMCFTNITFVTEDSIVCCSPSNPQGKTYRYQDITQVEAKFGSGIRTLALNEYEKKGNFQYAITLDGEKYIFSLPSVNPEIKYYQEDTYLELEEFDAALMALGIPKKSSDDGSEYCDFDGRYRDRFLRIIHSTGSGQ